MRGGKAALEVCNELRLRADLLRSVADVLDHPLKLQIVFGPQAGPKIIIHLAPPKRGRFACAGLAALARAASSRRLRSFPGHVQLLNTQARRRSTARSRPAAPRSGFAGHPAGDRSTDGEALLCRYGRSHPGDR